MLDYTVTVSQLNTYAKTLLEGDSRLFGIGVTGEISNFKNHYQSGHWYFTLKDNDASIRCVMFRNSAMRVGFSVEDGMRVTVRGRVSIYEKDGQYQFYAESMLRLGEGDISAEFERVKKKLEAEGLFDIENKRPLPQFPKRIAVITSDTGAAVKDILNITSRRYPLCDIVLCPATVQGENAPRDLIDTLERVYALDDIDVIIIGRGGGSAEDLSCFNDEALARKIYESPFPVISAVGHETDFTICDFVSDVRASTPSHAAELAVPDGNKLSFDVFALSRTLITKLNVKYQLSLAKYDAVMNRRVLSYPLSLLDTRVQTNDFLYDKICTTMDKRSNDNTSRLSNIVARLDALSPLKTMSRGFAVAEKNGSLIKSIQDISKDDSIDVKFFDGTVNCKVMNVPERKKDE